VIYDMHAMQTREIVQGSSRGCVKAGPPHPYFEYLILLALRLIKLSIAVTT